MRKKTIDQEECIPQGIPASSHASTDNTELDKALLIMRETHNTNLEALETYLDILKSKKKNINSKFIKAIYKMFSENRGNQLFYEKQAKLLKNEPDQRTLQRYYARVIELGIRKISFYWLNASSLEFLCPHIVNFMKQLNTCFNDALKRKNLKSHFKLLNLLFKQNTAIEKKIYDLLIQDGYLASMDEFYRINGIGVVKDQEYTRRRFNEINSDNNSDNGDSEEDGGSSCLDQILKPNPRNLHNSKGSFRDQHSFTPTQIDKNMKKIKKTMETMLGNIKETLLQEKKNKLTTIKEVRRESYNCSQTAKVGEQNPSFEEKKRDPMPRMSQRISNVNLDSKRVTKRVSIEMMSYFSNEIKSMITNTNHKEVDFNSLSQLIVITSSKNAQHKRRRSHKTTNEDHRLMSTVSLTLVKQQRERGKILQLGSSMKNRSQIQGMYEDLNEAAIFQRTSSRKSHFHPKFSFKSAPGVYITFNQDTIKDSNDNQLSSSPRAKNKFRIRPLQPFPQEPIFQNQAILNQLAFRKEQESSPAQAYSIKGNSVNILAIGYDQNQIKSITEDQQQRKADKNINFIRESTSTGKKSLNSSATLRDKMFTRSDYYRMTSIKSKLSHNYGKTSQTFCGGEEKSIRTTAKFAVFDRIRRKIVMAR